MEGAQGGGVLVVTRWLRGEAGHAWGLRHQPPQCANLPLGAGSVAQWVLPRCPLFSAPEVAYITLRWAFRRLLRHRIRNKGAGGAWQHTGGAWTWKPLPGKALSPIREPIGVGDSTQPREAV